MKILFLIRALNQGGAQRQLINLSKELHSRGYKITVCVYYSGGELESELISSSIPVISMNKNHRWDVFGFLFNLIRTIKKERPDIIHAYLSTANVLSVLIRLFSLKTRIIWGIRSSNMEMDRYDWLWSFSYYLERKLSIFTDLIIVNSVSGKQHSEKMGFPKEKMVVIQNGIDTSHYKPDFALRAEFRKEWNIKDNEQLVGLVARLDPKKDHATFIKAAAEISKIRDKVKFIFVGRGDEKYREKLDVLSRKNNLQNSIIWAGVRNDMNAVYNGLDILCLSSSFGEGFPNVIGEAMACGKPCVSTDVGDAKVIIGKTGVVVPPQSDQSLARGMITMLSNLTTVQEREDSAKLCRNRILENFDLHTLVYKTIQEIDNFNLIKQ